ncbi:MAG TPA: hypothetical protein VMY35_04785 [Phycisphaerae bacterium]|nr:hypothetical protein [Phycisphaerae bacterium]
MANLTQRPMAFHGATSIVDSTQHPPLGATGVDTNGYEYLYVDFQAPFIAGELVVLDENYLATFLTSTSVGAVGVVMGTVSASDRFGWVMVRGQATSVVGTSNIADGGVIMGAAGTTGAGMAAAYNQASDAGNIIYGAIARSAGTSATSFTVGDGSTQGSTFTMQLHYPFVLGLTHHLSSGVST